MNPGRELDSLIAEKVMGFTSVQVERSFDPYDIGPKYMIGNENKPENCIQSITRNNKKIYLLDMPHYSEDIAAAWKVVEKVKASQEGKIFYLQNAEGYNSKLKGWEAGFGYPSANGVDGGDICGFSENPAHAICLAALKAMGVVV